MLSLSPSSGASRLKDPLESKTTSILRVLLFLILAGCSAEDETVPPSQSHTPTIVTEPSVVVSGLGARITATINPNGIDTDCYFEYGPTDTYGRQLATKFIQAKLNDVVVSDTIANLGVDTMYHCRLVATNAAGTTYSIDKTFSVAHTPPTIETETAVTVAGQKVVVLTATVNANNRSTESHFEYGQTTSYGMRTSSRSIGTGGGGVVVRDTIRGLAFDTTYHCRVVAENAAGKTSGADQSFICPSASWKNFAFPLDAGTTWHYAYSLSHRAWPIYIYTRGHQVWRSAGPGSTNAITILVTRIDTAITIMWPYNGRGDTTTVIARVDTSFSIMVTADSLYIQWYQLSFISTVSWVPDLFKIPRIVEQSKDTLTLRIWPYQGHATYVSGKGLIFWEGNTGSVSGYDERLTLESVSP